MYKLIFNWAFYFLVSKLHPFCGIANRQEAGKLGDELSKELAVLLVNNKSFESNVTLIEI